MWPVIEEQERPDEHSEETQGLVASVSSLSLAKSDVSSRGARSRHSSAQYHKMGSLDDYILASDDPSSPASDLGSPKATFFLSKSRSNTVESGDFFFPSRRASEDEPRSRSGTVGSAVSSGGKSEGHMGDIEETPTDGAELSHSDVTDEANSSQYPASFLNVPEKANGGLGISKHRSISAPSEKSNTDAPTHARSQSEPVDPGQDIKRISSAEVMYKKALLRRKRTNTTESDSGRSGDFYSSKSMSLGEVDKSRSSSMFTDGTTSGIGSLESGHHTAMGDYPKLTPIPSASSLNTIQTRPLSDSSQGNEDDDKPKPKSTTHPSDSLRRLANLKRIPSTKRRYSNPVLGPLSKSLGNNQDLVEEYTLSYTSMQDAHGYAALRDIKSQRTISLDIDDQNMSVITEEPTSFLKTRSLADFGVRKST